MLSEDPWKAKRATLWMLIRIVVIYHSSPHSSPTSSHIELPMAAAVIPPLPHITSFHDMMSRTIIPELDDTPGAGAAGTKTGSSPPKAHLLKRVLSGGSSTTASASTPREAIATPPASSDPISPGSGGNRTPRAKKASLAEPGPEIVGAGDGRTQSLVTELDGLQMQSPVQAPAVLAHARKPVTHTRAGSSSTDSSSTGFHPDASNLGASYGSDGFPQMDDIQMSDTARRIAFTDEAVKSINGTATVFQGPPPTARNPYAMPRDFSRFVNPQPRSDRSPDVSRQSSTSSTATEASTSSEESDLCIPSIEYVTRENPLMPHIYSPRGGIPSPAQMPPPVINRSSPRKSAAEPPPTTGITTVYDIPSSSEQEDDDDDVATVGHGRERSPSASSLSAESGLDLLWKAAHSQEGTPIDSPESRGKRKAGAAEAVAQWRNSGIPTGPEVKPEHVASGPPKKRRRSENLLEKVIDPAIVEASAEKASENGIEDDAESEQPLSDHDSEYGAKGRGKVISKSGRGGAKKARGGRVSTDSAAGTGGSGAGKGGGGGKKGRKSDVPDENGAGGSGGSGGGGGRRGSGGAAANGGVQCEYVNPLPVSIRFLFSFSFAAGLMLTCIPAIQSLQRCLYPEIRPPSSYGSARSTRRRTCL